MAGALIISNEQTSAISGINQSAAAPLFVRGQADGLAAEPSQDVGVVLRSSYLSIHVAR
jgi:hypothetical protein